MKKYLTKKNLLILAFIIVGIYVWYKFFRTPSEADEELTPGNILNGGQNLTNINTSGTGTIPTPTSTSNTNTGTVISAELGKTAYAKYDGVRVYTDSTFQTVYKIAKKDEWIGIVENVSSPALYTVSGGKIVYKSNVYLS